MTLPPLAPTLTFPPTLLLRAQPVRVAFFDVDGVLTDGSLYFSADGGASFTAVKGGPSAGLMPQRAVISSKGKLYITYANGAGPHPADGEPMDNGQVWEYNAVGGNWVNITPAIRLTTSQVQTSIPICPKVSR